MAMLNISLTESIQAFIEEQVKKGGYSNASEYILHLIHQEKVKIAQYVEA